MNRMKARYLERQSNNQGFSLLELLIVVAVIAVISFATMISISVINKGNAKKANKYIYSYISELKTSTLSREGDWYVLIGKDDDKNEFYVATYRKRSDDAEYIEIDREVWSSTRVGVVFELNDGATEYDMKNYEIKISFSRANGACESVWLHDKISDAWMELMNSSYYGKFKVTGSGAEYTSTLWYKTGRVTCKN